MGQRKKVIFKLFLDMELKEVIVFGYQGDFISSRPMCVLSVNDNYIICCVKIINLIDQYLILCSLWVVLICFCSSKMVKKKSKEKVLS